MKRLILTTSDSGAGNIGAAGLADLLERTVRGKTKPEGIFKGLFQREQRGAFDYWEIGELLDGLAHCPAPAIAGLAEGPFTLEMHDDRERRNRYFESQLT